jgi:hypothetical protein
MKNGVEILSGELTTTTPTVLFTVSEGSTTSVTVMRFNNPAAFTLTVERYNASTSTLVKIYELDLKAGDVVTDGLLYYFLPNEYLQITSNPAGTTYYIATANTNPVNTTRK